MLVIDDFWQDHDLILLLLSEFSYQFGRRGGKVEWVIFVSEIEGLARANHASL
jgi:hypothetical protein